MRIDQTTARLLLGLSLALAGGLCWQNAIGHAQEEEETPAPVRPVLLEQSEAETRIVAALDQPTKLEFVEAPLSEVAAFLSENHSIPIVIDKNGLNGEGLGLDTPVTASLKNIRLRSALNLMLKEFALHYIIRDEVLLITTEYGAESRLITHAYNVLDLMQHPDSEILDADSLIELITNQVDIVSWDQVGGPGCISAFDGTLVVSQTREAHRQLQNLLTQLRRVKHALEHDSQKAFSGKWRVAEADQTKGTEKIRAALDKPLKHVEFVDTPFSDVVAFLRETTQIPIVVDSHALEGDGLGTDLPITGSYSNLKLRSVLNHMLNEFDLTYVIRDEVLLITTYEEAESQLNTGIFPIRDLLQSPAKAQFDADALSELITTTTAPTAWDEVGGPGSIVYFELCDVLVISQTEEILDQIEVLLGKIRKIRHDREPWSADEWAAQQEEYLKTPHFEYFTIPYDPNGELAVDTNTVVNFLQNSLTEELRKKAQIKVAQNSITMFLTPPEFGKVEALLQRSGLPVYRSSGSTFQHGSGFEGGRGGVGNGSGGEGGGFF
jgi:hypothetical protein